MENDGTYGGSTRGMTSGLSGINHYYDSPGDPITLETLQRGVESLKRMDESNAQWEREFWDSMRPYSGLATSDVDCYTALYRLYQSSRSPISKPEYDRLMEIVKSRGIEI